MKREFVDVTNPDTGEKIFVGFTYYVPHKVCNGGHFGTGELEDASMEVRANRRFGSHDEPENEHVSITIDGIGRLDIEHARGLYRALGEAIAEATKLVEQYPLVNYEQDQPALAAAGVSVLAGSH